VVRLYEVNPITKISYLLSLLEQRVPNLITDFMPQVMVGIPQFIR
jgi:hypothetical protein